LAAAKAGLAIIRQPLGNPMLTRTSEIASTMAKIPFDFRHYTYSHGLRMLEKGYTAARDALLAEMERIETEARVYEESLANGGEWIGEREDGHILWEQSQVYDAQIRDTVQALAEVRAAFVIALYHHWERSAAEWMGSDSTHEQLAKFCASMGYGPSPDLDAVRHLANHLKHGPNSRKNWLDKMREKHPLFLPPGPTPILGLSDDDLYRIAAIIMASGPPSPQSE
jgi:hypothetical protein